MAERLGGFGVATWVHAGARAPPADVLSQFNLRGAAAAAVTVVPLAALEAAAAEASLATKQVMTWA